MRLRGLRLALPPLRRPGSTLTEGSCLGRVHVCSLSMGRPALGPVYLWSHLSCQASGGLTPCPLPQSRSAPRASQAGKPSCDPAQVSGAETGGEASLRPRAMLWFAGDPEESEGLQGDSGGLQGGPGVKGCRWDLGGFQESAGEGGPSLGADSGQASGSWDAGPSGPGLWA